jgi:membrane protease subunit (stomatin/prohibitin family)
VTDPVKLVIGLVGLQKHEGNAFMQWFRQLVLKTIKDDIAELCVKKKWPLTDVTSGAYTEEIETEAIEGLRKHVDGYGLEIIRFGDFHIAMGQEDEERLNKFYEKASYINMAGGLQGYQQMAQADMMVNAGEGMAKGGSGGGAMQGAGLGLGFAMAGQMMNAANPAAQGQQQPAQPNIPPTGAPQGGAPSTVQCPKCSANVASGKFCAECGGELPRTKFCSNCGAQVGGKFCSECGTAAG